MEHIQHLISELSEIYCDDSHKYDIILHRLKVSAQMLQEIITKAWITDII